MDDLACPRCKTTKYRNPALKLLVNTCGHALCDSCVELLFVKGSGSCPECGIPLRRSAFRVQLFEDPGVEKEVDIRRRVLKDFTKQESDFNSLREYNDYLEEIETIIFNLVNNVELLETNKLIEQYKKDNKEQIAKSRNRKSTELLHLEAIIFQENQRSELRRHENLTSEKEEKLRKMKNHEALIDDLMFLESDAKQIVAQHKSSAQQAQVKAQRQEEISLPSLVQAQQQASTFTSGIGFGAASTFLPLPKVEEVPLFVYHAMVIDIGGPDPPTLGELRAQQSQSKAYLNHVRTASEGEVAGGYHHAIACRRALQDAFMDIAMQPKILKRINKEEDESESKMDMMDTS